MKITFKQVHCNLQKKVYNLRTNKKHTNKKKHTKEEDEDVK